MQRTTQKNHVDSCKLFSQPAVYRYIFYSNFWWDPFFFFYLFLFSPCPKLKVTKVRLVFGRITCLGHLDLETAQPRVTRKLIQEIEVNYNYIPYQILFYKLMVEYPKKHEISEFSVDRFNYNIYFIYLNRRDCYFTPNTYHT